MKVKVMTLLFAVLVACVCSHATLVAVLETTSDAKLTNWDENAYVTDKLREYAGRTLANKGITIMTRENAHAILEGKALEDCVGSCAVETGKNLRADFVVNAHVGKFGKMLTMTVELYEVETKKLFGSFTLKKKTADELMVALEQEAPALFRTVLREDDSTSEYFVGIADVERAGTDFDLTLPRSYVVEFTGTPDGAEVSMNGVHCSIPCVMETQEGSHSVFVRKQLYLDKDTVLNVVGKNTTLRVNLEKNTGLVVIGTSLKRDYAKMGDVEVSINGSRNELGTGRFELVAGYYKLKLEHRCYESWTTTIDVERNREHRVTANMETLKSKLNIKPGDEETRNAPVYVDGVKVGNVPFTSEVPVCAKVELGADREPLPVALVAGRTVSYTLEGNTLRDPRDGQKYKTVKIGNQVWMAQNLNYDPGDVSGMGYYAWSGCYDNKPSNCTKYGRLYTWEVAMDNADCASGKTCNASLKPSTPVRGVCPSGWHLPSHREFEELINFIDPSFGYNHTDAAISSTAGNYLKSKSGWNSNGNGTDAYGFSALPGGYRRGRDSFYDVGLNALFWSSGEYGSDYAFVLGLYYFYWNAAIGDSGKDGARSVRCVRD